MNAWERKKALAKEKLLLLMKAETFEGNSGNGVTQRANNSRIASEKLKGVVWVKLID